ncbi:hypothetical protein C0995_014201 [Termitomyces sp. Mi166|nr:hypothetical protein C0995_014201 [Termitomyces sp. Mi166\
MSTTDVQVLDQDQVERSVRRAPFGLRWRSSYWFTTFTVMLGIIVDVLVYTIIVPVMPFHLEQLGYHGVSALTGWLLFAYSAGLVLSTPPIAVFSERYNTRRIPLIIGLLLLAGSQVMLMEAPTYPVMCIARVLQGISSAMVWTIGLALVCDATPENLIGRQLGIAMGGLSIGSLIGPPVGGALFARFGYRGPFILGIAWTIVDLVARLLIIERKEALQYSMDSHQVDADKEKSGNQHSGLPDQLPVEEEKFAPERDNTLMSENVPPLSCSDADKDKQQKLSRRSLMVILLKLTKSSRALVAFFLTFAYGVIYTIQEPTLPLHLQDVWGLNPAKVGLVFLASIVPTLFSTPLTGWYSDKKGPEWVAFACLILALPWSVVVILRKSLALFIVAFALETFFASGLLSPVTAELAHVSQGIDGVGYAHVYGVFNIAYGVGSAVGPLIGGQMYDHLTDGWLAPHGWKQGTKSPEKKDRESQRSSPSQSLARPHLLLVSHPLSAPAIVHRARNPARPKSINSPESPQAIMSANSYPSLLSATTLPQSDNHDLPPLTTNLTTESSQRDRAETQATFQQASVALEAAYRRIRQFRRSILEGADSATSGEHQSRPSADDNFGPPSNVRDSSSPTSHDDSYVPSPPQHPVVRPLSTSGRRLNRDLPPLSTPSSSSSPLASQTSHPHLARSQLESWSQRHPEILTDDAATTLGRRVAAREAARASTTNSGRSTSNPFSRFEGNLAQLISTLEREFDHLRQQRSELSRTLPGDTRSAVLSRRTIELRRQLAAQSREASSPSNSSLVPQTDFLRRRLTTSVFPSRSSTMSSRSGQLSLLSNLSSVQNLPTPVSTSSSRPLLFEEPTSYLQGTDTFNEISSDTLSNEYGSESDRSYVVRRRLSADGEEHVHPINLEWLDEPLIYVGQGTRRAAQRGQPDVVSQRRQDWARLDPDGNEIPFEQEELERARSEYHLQAGLEMQSPNSPVQTTDPGFHSFQTLITSTSLAPDDDDDGIPRVRLNNSGSRQYRRSVKENVDLKSLEKSITSPVKPFRPCPLPTPLEDMTWTPPSRKPLRANKVSKNASFAGR